MAVINGEKGRAAITELRSISEELKTMLNDTDADGMTIKRRMAEIVMRRAADSPKWFELMLKLAGEMPAEHISLINTKPDTEAVQRMIRKLHEHDADTERRQQPPTSEEARSK